MVQVNNIDVSLNVVCGAAVVLLCVLLGSLFLFQNKRSNEKPSLKKSKSVYDISVGLQNEEMRSSPSCSSLQTMNTTSSDVRVLSPSEFRPFVVLKSVRVSHNTKLIRFEIPHGRSLGLPIGKHITLRVRVDSNNDHSSCAEVSKVMRAYTPTSRPNQTGYFDLLIKSYEFGKMSTYLHSLRPGQSVDVRGPLGRFKYTPSQFPAPHCMGLIAGGTGITPCLQVLRCALEGDAAINDTNCFTLLYQNRTFEDILLKEELDLLEKKFSSRLRVVYFLSNCSESYEGVVRGYIDKAAVKKYLNLSICPFVGICGPSGFNDCAKRLLVEEGHVLDDASCASTVNATVYVW
jgi:cytochrome-b5 reductase